MYNDVSPLDIRTADNALDLNVARCTDRESALHISVNLDAAGEVDIPRTDINSCVDHKMRVDADLLSIVNDLPVDNCHEFMCIYNLRILSLRKRHGFPGLGGNLLSEHICPRRSRRLGDVHGDDIANLCTDEDVHILVVHAVKGTQCGPPLFPHIEFLFDACVRPCDWCCSTRCHKGGHPCNTAPNCIAVDPVNDLLRRKPVQYIGNRWRQIALLIIKAYRSRHRIRCNLNGKGDDNILRSVLRLRFESRFNTVRSPHDTCELQDIVVCNPLILKVLAQRCQINNGSPLTFRIDRNVVSVRLHNKLKALPFSPDRTLHSITPDPSNRSCSGFFIHCHRKHRFRNRCSYPSSFIRASEPRIRKIAFVWSCEMRASERCKIAAISLSVSSS